MSSLIKQIYHITKTFGTKHALNRIASAIRAKINEYSRDRLHKKRLLTFDGKEKIIINCLGKLFELKTTDQGLHRDLIADRIREPVATSLMLHYAQPGYVLLDAGANIGYFSILLADRCKEVYAVEPDVENFNALNRNLKINNASNIKTFNFAFSNKSEILYLNRSDKSNWHTTSKSANSEDAIKIESITIDDFCDKQNIQPDIIKMDIEGFERYVIPGAKNILEGVSYLFFELHSTHMSIKEVNVLLDIIDESGLKIINIIRYDRPGLWIEEEHNQIDRIRKGDFGIYELIYCR